MTDFTKEFEQVAKAQRDQVRQRDYDDLNHELAGVDVGRMPRFLSPESRDAIGRSGTGRGRGTAKMTVLDILLLNDPHYAQMYSATLDTNRSGQAHVTSLGDRITNAKSKIDAKLEETLELAVTLPDGRKAFMDKNGDVYTQDNELVDPAIAEGIDWEGRPSYEAYLSLTRDRAKLEQLAKENDAIGLRFGEFAVRLEDEDAPPSKPELEEIQVQQETDIERIKEIDAEVQVIERQMASDVAAPSVNQNTSISSAPKVDSLNF